MKRILKNTIRENVYTVFRGRTKCIKSKAAAVFDMDDEEQSKEYFHWVSIYGFLRDITELVNPKEVKPSAN